MNLTFVSSTLLSLPSFINQCPLRPSKSICHNTTIQQSHQYRRTHANLFMCTSKSVQVDIDSNQQHTHTQTKPDVIIIGAGISGLCAGALLTAYGKKPLILESHDRAGGCGHGFSVKNEEGEFHFDTGPSFFCNFKSPSLNPVEHILSLLNENVQYESYDYYTYNDIKGNKSMKIYSDENKTLNQLPKVSRSSLSKLYNKVYAIYKYMKIPSIALRGDWISLGRIVSSRQSWLKQLLFLLPSIGILENPFSLLLNQIQDKFVLNLLNIECFLLSGLKSNQTIAAEVIFMFGERSKFKSMQYPINGLNQIISKMCNGIINNGGSIEYNTHVEQILLNEENNKAIGVQIKNKSKQKIYAPLIICTISIWDLMNKLLPTLTSTSTSIQQQQNKSKDIQVIDSFIHLHIAIPIDRETMSKTSGHHVFLMDNDQDISNPGNTIMLSIPTIWSPSLAPNDGWHILHAYTLEPYNKWPAVRKQGRTIYEQEKKQAAQPLFKAIQTIIPDLHERLAHPNAICKIGSPLTHERFNRRYKGTYGAAIRAGREKFDWPGDFPIQNLKRCGGDSTFPGIGVPAAAASAMICVNELFDVEQHKEVINRVFPAHYDDLV